MAIFNLRFPNGTPLANALHNGIPLAHSLPLVIFEQEQNLDTIRKPSSCVAFGTKEAAIPSDVANQSHLLMAV